MGDYLPDSFPTLLNKDKKSLKIWYDYVRSQLLVITLTFSKSKYVA